MEELKSEENINKFYKMREEEVLGSNLPTKELLLELRSVSKYYYQKLSAENFDEGGQSQISEIICKVDGKEYVLKEYKLNFSDIAIKDIDKEHILREIDNLRQLKNSPLVVKMVDIVQSFENKTAIVLQFCDGSLQKIIDEKLEAEENFQEEEILDIIKSVAKSLQQVHSMDIIHRDVKPDNILFITENGIKNWKLADFGSSSKKGTKLKNTNTIRKAFTDAYASIEQLYEQKAEPYFDVWSLGVTAFYLMSGCLPFDDKKNLQQKERKKSKI